MMFEVLGEPRHRYKVYFWIKLINISIIIITQKMMKYSVINLGTENDYNFSESDSQRKANSR